MLTPGSAPYPAVAAVLGRIDTEVVAINLRNALQSDLPITQSTAALLAGDGLRAYCAFSRRPGA